MPKNPDTLDTITAWLSHFWRETHTALKKYCLDSRRASVDLPARDELRLIDFEFGRLGHALMDGTYGRMIFPSCWCANRLPAFSKVAEELDIRRFGSEALARTSKVTEKTPRCAWARTPLSVAYHDLEWGVPVHDDRILFEFLTLEGAQAGLSWETILKKREAYREAFAGFDPAAVAEFGPAQVDRLLANPGIVRNRLKIRSTVGNARAFLAVQHEFGSFDAYMWRFVGGRPRVNRWRTLRQVPARTSDSDALSRDLLARGFKFVGSTICYAFMQAVGVVNDHTVDCFRYERVGL
jgi:DNA-3-methyladenine glycosylase I